MAARGIDAIERIQSAARGRRLVAGGAAAASAAPVLPAYLAFGHQRGLGERATIALPRLLRT